MNGMSIAIVLVLLQVFPAANWRSTNGAGTPFQSQTGGIQQNPAAVKLPCEQTIALKPDDIDALSLCGEIYVKRGNYQRGIDILRQITKLAAWSAKDHYYAGFAFYKLHSWEAAQQQLEITISLSPENPAAYVYLGDVYQQTGNKDAGILMFEEYLKRFPHDINHAAVAKMVKQLRNEK